MYTNPKPTLDDEYVAQSFVIPLNFDEPMTAKDAAINIENYIKTNGLPQNWVHLGKAKMLASPEKLNILKDKLENPRLSGEWIPCTNNGALEHCQCSICGHIEPLDKTIDEDTAYKFCPKCGSSMASAGNKHAHIRQKLRIESPHGRIEADKIPDDTFPGITVTAINEDGDEISCAILEWNDSQQCFMLRVYSYEKPDDDPIKVIRMSRVYDGPDDKAIQNAVFAQVWADEPTKEPVTLTTTCKINTNTGEIFDISPITTVGFTTLLREYVTTGGKEYPAVNLYEKSKIQAGTYRYKEPQENEYWYNGKGALAHEQT